MKSVLQGFIPPEDATAGEEGEPLSPSSEALAAAPSPRAQRAADAASALLNPADLGLHHLEPQDTYGMRSRQLFTHSDLMCAAIVFQKEHALPR